MAAPDPSWLFVLFERSSWWVRRVLSSVGVGTHDVRVRNFPGRRQTFALEEVERFDWRHRALREVGVLLLTDGKTIEVCALDQNRPGTVAELNNRLLAAGQ